MNKGFLNKKSFHVNNLNNVEKVCNYFVLCSAAYANIMQMLGMDG